jgi:squalene synthase HpnC
VAVVPARNEAEGIERALRSLEAQDYRGAFRIIVVDDQSTDDTAGRVRSLCSDRIMLIAGSARPQGWTGKLWALQQGIDAAAQTRPEFLWLTDADIVHAPDNLWRLVERAEKGKLALVSLMAKLCCESAAERLLIPAFVFFFAMLYPFAWVNNITRKVAAAAGGCMLVRRETLQSAGSIAAIRGEIIDDCALARRLKAHGPIWLGLTSRSVSIRPYAQFSDIRGMVSRSAFAQLHYSWSMVVLTIIGMGAIYVAPPILAIFAHGPARFAAAAAWLAMAVSLMPMLRFYRRNPLWGFALPVTAACYAAFTLDSAIQHRRGRGGMWKGRAQAAADTSPKRSKSLRAADAARDGSPSLASPSLGSPGMPTRELSSGKGHRDENFPVASFLIAPQHRSIILAFYRFVREADDIADHAQASADEKLHRLEQMRRSLTGESAAVENGVRLRDLLSQRGITDRHALDLLTAFRRDVTRLRYRDWDDLVDYCSVSAMPVGRFVLNVHGESPTIWPMNDALCAALQIINHLQDCGADYRNLDRVYIPLDAFSSAGTTPEALAKTRASPELQTAIRSVASRNDILLQKAAGFANAITDRRLSLEVSVIHRLAVDLNRRLLVRDPLSQPVHHGRAEAAMLGLKAIVPQLLRGGRRKRPMMAGAE